MELYRLSNKVEQTFFEDGFVVIRSAFKPADIEAISNSLNQLKVTAKKFRTPTLHKNSYFVVEEERIHRIVWCCGELPVLADYGRDPRITKYVAKILGSKDLITSSVNLITKLPEIMLPLIGIKILNTEVMELKNGRI